MSQPARYVFPVSARARAFTLIEILVVVAIIALLIAVLIPSLKKARDQAKSAACKANLHDFGIAIQQYVSEHDPYYPLVPYIGSTIWYDNPGADDNLFVLWWRKYTRNVDTHTCPATVHRIRTPERIDKVAMATGLRFNIYTNGELRNDFEFHGQVIEELVQDPAYNYVEVRGHGTSYEYMGWVSGAPGTSTKLDWYPFRRQKTVAGEPRTTSNTKNPAAAWMMKDSDEGTPREIVGAPPGGGINNYPEPWDNHGAKYSNVLFGDAHVETFGLGFWDKYRQNKP